MMAEKSFCYSSESHLTKSAGMFNPSRDQARRLFFDTWHKYQQKEPLSGIETIAIEVILQHPEYHSMLQDTARYLDKDFPPEQGKACHQSADRHPPAFRAAKNQAAGR